MYYLPHASPSHLNKQLWNEQPNKHRNAYKSGHIIYLNIGPKIHKQLLAHHWRTLFIKTNARSKTMQCHMQTLYGIPMSMDIGITLWYILFVKDVEMTCWATMARVAHQQMTWYSHLLTNARTKNSTQSMMKCAWDKEHAILKSSQYSYLHRCPHAINIHIANSQMTWIEEIIIISTLYNMYVNQRHD